MRIARYQYQDPENRGWNFSEVQFGKINLLVGDSGMGKTRLLNTLFNIAAMIASKQIAPGIWKLDLEVNGIKYKWRVETHGDEQKRPIVSFEELTKCEGNESKIIVKRNAETFTYNDKELPKLSRNESCISLLQEEDEIHQIFKGFSSILRRRFFEADLTERCRIEGFPFGLLDNLSKARNLSDLYPTLHSKELNLNSIMYILLKGYREIFTKIAGIYKSVFPFITDIKVMDIQELNQEIKLPGQIPVFCIKEKSIDHWITLNDLSSGMQKVLLILTDLFTMPQGSIYLVDEYENSLGINAINFFPNVLLEEDFDIQFFITSHHPYIINKIPVASWYVLHRTGSSVNIMFGDKLQKRFGASKQQAFIRLLNDSFFTEGKE